MQSKNGVVEVAGRNWLLVSDRSSGGGEAQHPQKTTADRSVERSPQCLSLELTDSQPFCPFQVVRVV